MVTKAADRSRRQRHDNFCDPMALMIMGCFSEVMFAVGTVPDLVKIGPCSETNVGALIH